MKHQAGEISRNVAGNVRRLRKARGWSIAKPAERCEELGAPWLQFAALANIERNPDGANEQTRQPRRVVVDELFVLAQALGTSAATLMGGEACPNCFDKPPRGFACLTCGVSQNEEAA